MRKRAVAVAHAGYEMQNLTSPLAVAYAAWVAARAKVAAADAAPSRFTDRRSSAVVQAGIDAERALLTAPAADLADIRLRAVIVEQMFADAEDIGPPTDGRHLKMLSVLLREIAEYTPS